MSELLFLLTHPVWDVTHIYPFLWSAIKFLLTHPVWDVTNHRIMLFYFFLISTHTSRVGCDKNRLHRKPGYSVISTHTSRVGCDDRIISV